MKITIEGPRQNDGSLPTVDVDVPALPQIGGHVSHDAHDGISGYVKDVAFWWDEKGKLTIAVQLK
ncbi:MAG: hypothetical protein K5872_22185 [Rhizobiaceae bacterium]|nr:hypothetical protein [Rhizobiaceae bacterium]MCV0408930.1 hypothetical protein [Rhizobiaceae bacterium]